MSVIETKIMINSQDFKKNEKDHLELIDEFRNLEKIQRNIEEKRNE